MCASLKTNLNERNSVIYFVAILAPFKHRCSVLKLTSLVVKLYLNLAAMRKLILCCLIAVSLSAELREQPDKKEIPPQVQDQKNEIPARKEEQKPEKKETPNSRNLPRSRFHHKRKSRNLS